MGLLSHAEYVTRIDDSFLRQIVGNDPLLLYDRYKGSDEDFQAGLGRIRSIVESAENSGESLDRAHLVVDLRAATASLINTLETRSMIMVQLTDYIYADSKVRMAHLLHHSNSLVLWFTALFLALRPQLASISGPF